ncbi:hypothetical protein D3C80_1546560 [compost metagenome]
MFFNKINRLCLRAANGHLLVRLKGGPYFFGLQRYLIISKLTNFNCYFPAPAASPALLRQRDNLSGSADLCRGSVCGVCAAAGIPCPLWSQIVH